MSRDPFPDDPREASGSPETRSARRRGRGSTDQQSAGSRTPVDRDHPPVRESRDQRPDRSDREEQRRAYYLRDRAFLLRDSEKDTLVDIGTFRVIRVKDLAEFAYHGNRERMERDLRHLRNEGLVADRTLEISRGKSLRVVTLTKAGYRLVKSSGWTSEDQAVYYGLRKPREAKHDADLYRVYQKEVARIRKAGGEPRRVVLDYELKRNLNRDLALLGGARINPDRRREVAEKHGLSMVDEKIPVPDLRVEYQDAESEIQRVDLELATREYRPRAFSEKAASGFSLYSRPEDFSRLRRILDEREITAEILSL